MIFGLDALWILVILILALGIVWGISKKKAPLETPPSSNPVGTNPSAQGDSKTPLSNPDHQNQQTSSSPELNPLRETTPGISSPVRRRWLPRWIWLENLLQTSTVVDPQLLDSLWEQLMEKDVGVHVADTWVQKLKQHPGPLTWDLAIAYLSQWTQEALMTLYRSDFRQTPDVSRGKPVVWLVFGTNGCGKTTTIAKWARAGVNQNLAVRVLAADTFRAAAREQLRTLIEPTGAQFFTLENTKDPAAVVFQGLTGAQKENDDWVIIDTAGRLPDNHNLTQELKKLEQTVLKFVASNQIFRVLILDGTLGQVNLKYVETFHRSIHLDALCVTKLDTSAKAGFLLPLSQSLPIPVYCVTFGESLEDWALFDPVHLTQEFWQQKPPPTP